MNRIVLTDSSKRRADLLPLSLTRAICDVRCGIMTTINRWQSRYPSSHIEVATAPYLHNHVALPIQDDSAIIVDSSWINGPDEPQIKNLAPQESIIYQDKVIAYHSTKFSPTHSLQDLGQSSIKKRHPSNAPILLEYPEQLTKLTAGFIKSDFESLTGISQDPIPVGITLIGDKRNLHIGKNAKLPHCVINVSEGPVYISDDATIMEGAMLRGPLFIGKGTKINMGAKIYGSTSIGHYCKVGGEIKRSVIFDYTNKGHDGFLGDSVIGSWCNIGADTNTSNMKNTYGTINTWDISNNAKRNTSKQFVGLIMGDHSKCGINTQFLPGAMVGVFASIFDTRPSAYVPSFSWGSDEKYNIDKAIEVARIVYQRRNKNLSPGEEAILRHLYQEYA